MAQQNEKDNVQMMNDVFEAVSLIAAKQIEHLEFDKTLKCQIIDDSNKELGEYTVTDGVTDFVAYSENQQLRAGNWVFVTVPNNDFSQQKFITGKYTTDESEYYTYVNPMETYINMTGNLNTSDNTWKLVANHEAIKEVEIFRMGDTDPQNDAPIDSSSHMLAGFDRLGIQADFRSELGQYDIVSGHYGINVRVKSFTPSVIKMNDTTTEEQGYFKWTKLSLDSSDMFGNPYDFFIQTTQQVVFDISQLGEIVGILVTFYQSNDFLTRQKRRIPIISASENAEEAKEIYYNRSNLFASNINVSLGYDLSNFEDDTLLLTTFDSPIYSYVAGSDNTQNIKHLSLRWIHHDENNNLVPIDEIGDILLDEEGNPMIDIHWYKWKFANNVEDELAGTFWEEISDIENLFQYNLNPSNDVEEERVKVIIQSPSESYIISLVNNFIPDLDLIEEGVSQEQQKAEYERDLRSEIILYESNILDFTNEQEAPNLASVNLVRGLNLICDPEYGNGIYRIYDSYGQLLDKNQGYKQRRIIAHFNAVVLRDESTSPTYDVTWYIPAQQSMIVPPDAYKIETVEGEEQTSLIKPYSDPELSADGKYYIIKQTQDNIIEQGNAEERLIKVEFEIPFKIRNFYNKLWNNNTIRCEIMRNGIPYVAETELSFSTASSNGTEYALAADFFDGNGNNLGAPIFYVDKADFKLKIVPHVFDNNGIEVTDKSHIFYLPYAGAIGFNIERDDDGNGIISMVTTNSAGEPYTPSGKDFYNYIVTLKVTRAVNLKEYIEVDIGNNQTEIREQESTKTVDLTEQIPIAVCFHSDKTKGLIGDNRIIYDSNGTNPQYYKSPYQLIDTPTDPPIVWSMHLNLDEYKGAAVRQYYPQIDAQSGELTVPPIFMSGNQKGISILASIQGDVIWCQPLYIAQDVYASKFLNTWNGQLTVDEDGNQIMAALIGAGLKNNDNTFSGVLMGDVAGHGDINSPLGLYGYDHGEQSYGFKVDGSAFIGKQGAGRISFNERDGGIIESGNYSSSNKQAGMHIDLVNGKIDIPLQGQNATGQSILLDGSPGTTRPFGIGELLYLKSDGSLYIKGEVHATNGTFTGSLDGFSGHFGHGTQGNAQTRIDLDVNADGYAYIQSGQHLSWNSKKPGFYLSGEGLSIGSHFYVDSDGNVTATSLSLGDDADNFYSGIWDYFGMNNYAKKSDLTLYVQKDGTISGTEDGAVRSITISSQGLLTASNAIISGHIVANSGTFTGTIYASAGHIGRDNDYKIVIGNSQTNPQYAYLRSGTRNALTGGQGFWLAQNGFSMGDNFIVNSHGDLEGINLFNNSAYRSYYSTDTNRETPIALIYLSNSNNLVLGRTLYQNTDNNINGQLELYGKEINIHSQTTFGGNVAYTGSSDIRLKTNIKELSSATDNFLLKLKTFSYNWKTELSDYDRLIHYGFSAQDVITLLQQNNIDYTKLGLVSKSKDGYFGIAYSEFIPMIVHLCQEQHKEIEQLKQQVEALMNK